AATRIATLLVSKGGTVAEITVGDCVELIETMAQVHSRRGQKKIDFYLRLRAMGIFPEDAPHSIRAFGAPVGQLTIEQLVDRYPIENQPIR
ncbi:site-specific integrase, partial [Rhodococcus qingshengii]